MKPRHQFMLFVRLGLALGVGLQFGSFGCQPGLDRQENSHEETLDPYIIHGQTTSAFPYVGLLRTKNGYGACTATLIGPQTVISAAHCFVGGPEFSSGNWSDATVNKNASIELGGRTYAGTASIYPGPNPAWWENDLAVLRLNQPVQGIEPAILNTQPPAPNETITMVGIGQTSYDNKAFGTKRYAHNRVAEVRSRTYVYHWNSQNADMNRGGICYGDSGGPTFRGGDTGANVLIGVHTGVDEFCTAEGTDLRVDIVLDWVLANAHPNDRLGVTRKAKGDVNGDGRADLVTHHSGGDLYVYPGTAQGNFADNKVAYKGVSTALWWKAGYLFHDLADVNGDDLSDLIATDSQEGGARVFLAQGDGTFAYPVSSLSHHFRATSTEKDRVVGIADVDGDALADMVVHTDQGAIYVFKAIASGAFLDHSHVSALGSVILNPGYLKGDGYNVLGVADVTGDRKADLVVNHRNGSVYVYPGQANATFSDAGVVASLLGKILVDPRAAHGVEVVDLEDVNGDARADLVTLDVEGTAHVYLGQATGAFSAESADTFARTLNSALTDGDGHLVIGVMDITGDGRGDLVTYHTSGVVFVYPGLSSGHFNTGVESFKGTMNGSFKDGVGHEFVTQQALYRRRGDDGSCRNQTGANSFQLDDFQGVRCQTGTGTANPSTNKDRLSSDYSLKSPTTCTKTGLSEYEYMGVRCEGGCGGKYYDVYWLGCDSSSAKEVHDPTPSVNGGALHDWACRTCSWCNSGFGDCL